MSSPMPRVVHRLIDHDRGRDPQRLLLKYARIRQSPFAFLRATAFLYFEDSPLTGVLAASPRAWLCGDLHLENFGTYRGANGLVYFDVNDFDEAALGPVMWDLGRLVTSMLVASRESDWPAKAWTSAAERCVAAYAAALAAGKPLWIERRTAAGPVRRLLRQLSRRPQRALLKARTTGTGDARRLIKDGTHALPASVADRRRVGGLLRGLGAGVGVAAPKVLDVARRIAGTGSLGMERYVALVAGHGGRDEAHLIDLKTEARPACLAAGGDSGPWHCDAQRTVEIQRVAQAVPPAGLSAQRIGATHYVMRELQPSEDRLDFDGMGDPAALAVAAEDLGRVAAWAHLRGAGRHGSALVEELMEFGRRRDWRSPLLAHAREARRTILALQHDYARVNSDVFLAAAGIPPARRRLS